MGKSILLSFLYFFVLALLLTPNTSFAHSSIDDSLKRSPFSIAGGIDAYYAYNAINSDLQELPYYVSMARNNEFNINLAYIDFKYETEQVKMRFIPAIGTYMNANYSLEPGLLKIPIEANAGVQLSKKKNIWLEAGIFLSPYTNENPFNKEQLMYSRSLAPEYVPYYVTGLKTTIPLSSKLKFYGYILNGWQQIKDLNKGKSIGTTLEYMVNDKTKIYWNTYVGDERSIYRPEFRTRYFSDFYITYFNTKRLSFTSCAYIGVQEIAKNTVGRDYYLWWQGNFIAKYTFANSHSLSARIEYFSDPHSVQIQPITGAESFECFAPSLCYSIPFQENALIRFEAKNLIKTNQPLFLGKNGSVVNSMPIFYANLTVWF